MHVGQRGQLVDVPELEGPEEVPIWTTKERPEHNQRGPENDEPEQKNRHLGLPLDERVIAISLRVPVDIGNGDQAHDDQ